MVSLVFDFLIVDVILGIRCRIWQQSYLASTVAFKTLLSDKQCLSNTYQDLKDDLAFTAVTPNLGRLSSFTLSHNFLVRG